MTENDNHEPMPSIDVDVVVATGESPVSVGTEMALLSSAPASENTDPIPSIVPCPEVIPFSHAEPITRNYDFENIEYQIGQLRDLVIKIVPADEKIKDLKHIRDYAAFNRYAKRRFLFFRRRYYWSSSRLEFSLDGTFKERLAKIEAAVKSDSSGADLRQRLLELRELEDDIQIKIRRLSSTLASLRYSTTTGRELIEDLVKKIGHRELRDEGRMHLRIVSQLVKKLGAKPVLRSDEAVLYQETLEAVGVMIEVEQRKLSVEELVHKDRSRRTWTVGIVIFYIAFVLASTIGVGIQWSSKFLPGDAPLNDLKLPLLGIPWPVVLWSLIGSFAAMIYRFNKKPIYDFGDAVKWLLTRPVQGVVLGAAFYLVLVSGLFLLSGRSTSEGQSSHVANDVILILSFLVGFSDRFADSVFKAIVERYTQTTSRRGKVETN